MRGRIVPILSGLSLILCAASIALWIGSAFYQWNYTRAFDREQDRLVLIQSGQCSGLLLPADPRGLRFDGASLHRGTVSSEAFFRASFSLPHVVGRQWIFPLWLPALLFAALPLGRLVACIQSRRSGSAET